VLVEQVDAVCSEPAKRCLCDLADVIGAAVKAADTIIGRDVETKFGGDHHLLTDRRQRISNNFFIGVRAIELGSVEQRDPMLMRSTDQLDGVLAIGCGPVDPAEIHAAETQFRHFKATLTKRALFHLQSLRKLTEIPAFMGDRPEETYTLDGIVGMGL
jgi:hypothetical protein